MNLSNIRDWLKAEIECPQWFLNKMLTKADESITLYNTTGAAPRIALGGLDNTSYTNKPISILVHWGRSPSQSEAKAQEVYDLLFGASKITNNVINGKRVIMFDMRHADPVSVGTDTEGIYEFVIEVNIIHER